MFCTNCGEELTPEDNFCGNCGKAVSRRSAPRRPEAVPGSFNPQAHTSELPVPSKVRTSQSTTEVFNGSRMSPQAPEPVTLPPPARVPERVPPAPVIPPPPTRAAASEPLPPPPVTRVDQPPVELPPPSWLADNAAAQTASTPVPSQAASEAPAVSLEEPKLYMYDPTGGQSSHRGLLIAVLVLLVLGIIGIFYLMRPSPKTSAPSGTHASTNIGLTILPTTAELQPGNTLDVTATVTNGEGTDVGWVVQEGMEGGKLVTRGAQTVDANTTRLMAVYVAPQNPGTYHLVVTSKADESKSAEAVITVKSK